MGFSFSGVFTNIDTDALVAYTMQANSTTLNRFQVRKNTWEAKNSAIQALESRFETFKTLADSLNNRSEFSLSYASTSDRDVLGANVTSSGYVQGNYEIEVNQIAKAERRIQAGLDPTETWVGDKSITGVGEEYISADNISDNSGENYKFVFKFGSEDTVNVDLSGYDATGITLTQLVTEINTAAGYTAASADQDGDNYRLKLQASAAGDNKALVITDDNSVGILDSTDDFAEKSGSTKGPLVGEGQFVYTYDGETCTVTTDEWTTLQDMVNLINNDSNNPGVSASILKHDGATGGDYHLVLTGRNSGEDYALTVEAATTLSGFESGTGNWTVTQTARNSQVRVDGYPSVDWIERNSNTLTDVISGMTIDLATTGTATITLNQDTSSLESNLSNMVNAYNGIVDCVEGYTGYDEETGTSSLMQGDTTLNSLLSQIRGVFTGTVPGFDSSRDKYTILSQIGIEIDKDGYLSFDSSTFAEAMDEDYNAVLNLIGAVAIGDTDSDDVRFTSAGSTTQTGYYDLEVDFDASGDISAARIQHENADSFGSMSINGTKLSGWNDMPEYGLNLEVLGSGTSETKTYRVYVQDGFGGELYDKIDDMLDDVDGVFKLKKDQYDSAVDAVEKQIEWQEDRLERLEETLKAKYARLESLMAQLDSQRGAFEALFTSIDANSSGDE